MKMYPIIMADGSKQLALGIFQSAPVFDHKKAMEARRAAQALAEAQLVQWKIDAAQWVTDQGIGAEFTADDLVDNVGLPSYTDGRPNNNGIGAFFSGLSRRGIITKVGWTTSSRVSNHGSDLRLWRVVA